MPKRANASESDTSSTSTSRSGPHTLSDTVQKHTWTSRNGSASKRQRLAPGEPDSSFQPTPSSLPITSSGTSSSNLISRLLQNKPPHSGHLARAFPLPPHAIRGAPQLRARRKTWLHNKRKQLEKQKLIITRVYWVDNHAVMYLCPRGFRGDPSKVAVIAPNVDSSMDVDTEMSSKEPTEQRTGKRRRDEDDGSSDSSSDDSSESSSIPISPASRQPALLRADKPTPTLPTSQDVTLSASSVPIASTSQPIQSQTVAFVADLPFSIDDADLAALFTNAGITVNSVKIIRRYRNKSAGFGFVDVGSEKELKRAIAALHGKEVVGRAIAVKVAKGDETQTQQSTETTSLALSDTLPASQISPASSPNFRSSSTASSSALLSAHPNPQTLPKSFPVTPVPSAPHKPVLLRAGMPVPALRASLTIAPSASSTPSASTSKPAHPIRPSFIPPSLSGSRISSFVKPTALSQPATMSRIIPASRSALWAPSRPAQPSAPALSSFASSRMPLPALSMRSPDLSTSDSSDSSTSLPRVISAPTGRPALGSKPKDPPTSAKTVIVISSDDHRDSSSSDSEEDGLKSSDVECAARHRITDAPRLSLSPLLSSDSEEDDYPAAQLKLTVKDTASFPPNNDSGSRDKPRPALVDRTGKSIFTVMYHGFVDRFGRASRRRSNVYIPNEPAKQFIENACLLDLNDNAHVLMAHSSRAEGRQLTLVSRSGTVSHLKRRLKQNEKSGAAAVCALPAPHQFAASGFDHVVYHWTVTSAAPLASARLDEDSDEGDVVRSFSAHARPLQIKHTSTVRALLPLSSNLLASGSADCSVHIFDMGRQSIAHTLKPSNGVTNLHSLAATHQHGILLEVAHKDLQFEIRDTRARQEENFTRFGWLAGRTSGNYVRGSVRGDVFACGDRDGVLRVWDLRNAQDPIATKQVFSSATSTLAKIVHVVFDGSKLYALSEGRELAFMNTA